MLNIASMGYGMTVNVFQMIIHLELHSLNLMLFYHSFTFMTCEWALQLHPVFSRFVSSFLSPTLNNFSSADDNYICICWVHTKNGSLHIPDLWLRFWQSVSDIRFTIPWMLHLRCFKKARFSGLSTFWKSGPCSHIVNHKSLVASENVGLHA